MSGAFSIDYIDRLFGLSFVSPKRKIFRGLGQAERYFERARASFYERLAARRAGLNEELESALAEGLELHSLDLSRPVKPYSSKLEIEAPTGLAIELGRLWGGDLTLRLDAAGEVASLAPLLTALQARLKGPDGKSTSLEGAPLEHATIAECFGLYVGTNSEVLTQEHTRFGEQLRRAHERLLPKVEAWFTSGEMARELGGPLRALEEMEGVRTRWAQSARALFNPHGPLVDDETGDCLLRTSVERGAIKVIVLVSIKPYDWGKVNLGLERWLDAAFEV